MLASAVQVHTEQERVAPWMVPALSVSGLHSASLTGLLRLAATATRASSGVT